MLHNDCIRTNIEKMTEFKTKSANECWNESHSVNIAENSWM